jgi:hypothetical protein
MFNIVLYLQSLFLMLPYKLEYANYLYICKIQKKENCYTPTFIFYSLKIFSQIKSSKLSLNVLKKYILKFC